MYILVIALIIAALIALFLFVTSADPATSTRHIKQITRFVTTCLALAVVLILWSAFVTLSIRTTVYIFGSCSKEFLGIMLLFVGITSFVMPFWAVFEIVEKRTTKWETQD
jgi:hypothetical protein